MSGHPGGGGGGGGGGHIYGFPNDPARDPYIQNMINHASEALPQSYTSHPLSDAPHPNGTRNGPIADPFEHVSNDEDHLDDFDRQLLAGYPPYYSNDSARTICPASAIPPVSTIPSRSHVLNDASHHFRPYASRGEQARASQFTIGQINQHRLNHSPAILPQQFERNGSRRASELLGRPQLVTPPLHTPKPRQMSPKPLSLNSSSPSLDISSPSTRLSLKRSEPSIATKSSSSQIPASTGSMSMDLQHAPSTLTPKVAGVHLIDPQAVIPAKCRAVFPYSLFNVVQSKCFPHVFGCDDNVVVSAPTGSGKTAILEMAICKLVTNSNGQSFKIVYQAPTKSLCSERARDWGKKFSHLNLQCVELTGDTSPSEVRKVGGASIIVTTPEKWDSITRKWSDHHRLLDLVRLVLIDEVHIVKDIRGATLEAVVSRMKTSGANVRFIALSATVPNLDDLAVWFGRNHTDQEQPAQQLGFGEEVRPVKLKKYVHGFDSNPGQVHAFDSAINGMLISLLGQYGERKPIMVFCYTRKSCEQTAGKLAEWWNAVPNDDKPWPEPKSRVVVGNKDLQQIVTQGIAFHHAGLSAMDRSSVERSYLSGDLHVICCTSTLAVGVNLPCHTVVLKGTVGWADGNLQEYSDLEVMQMLGRAGRPQFDRSATAIIMTRSSNVKRYEKMMSGQEVLESKLHLNLIEHLNSEIGLGTIKSLCTAKKWLTGTFLFVRMRRAPKYYLLGMPELVNQSRFGPEDLMQACCERDIEQLQVHNLITPVEPLRCTEYGIAMSRYMVPFETMKELLDIPTSVDVKQLLICLSKTPTFQDLRLKSQDKGFLRRINSAVMYPVQGSPSETWHKVYLLVQFSLAALEIPADESKTIKQQIPTEKNIVLDRIKRLVRCVIDCKVFDGDGLSVKAGLELTRALAAKSWEDQPTQLLQISSLGPVTMRKLTCHGIRTISDLATRSFVDIERFVGRNPPYGKNILKDLEAFPRLSLTTSTLVQNNGAYLESEDAVMVMVNAVLGYQNKDVPNWKNRGHVFTFVAHTADGRLAHFARSSLKRVGESGNIDLKFPVAIRNANETITCCFSCEEIVGTEVKEVISPNLPPLALQSLKQRRVSSSPDKDPQNGQIDDIDGEGIEDADMLDAFGESEADVHKEREKQPWLAGNDDGHGSEFPDIDDLLDDTPASHLPDTTVAAPVRMGNGKWMCNHHCAGGAPTKTGKPCTHKCCHEGLNKPRPPNQKTSKKAKNDQAKNTTSADCDASMATNHTAVKERDLHKSKSSGGLDDGREDFIGRDSVSKTRGIPSSTDLKRTLHESFTSANEASDSIRSKKQRSNAQDEDIEYLDLCTTSGDERESQSTRQRNTVPHNRAKQRLSDLHSRIQAQTIAPSRLTRPCKALTTSEDASIAKTGSCHDSDILENVSEEFPPLPELLRKSAVSQQHAGIQNILFNDETLVPDIHQMLGDDGEYGHGLSLSFTTTSELEKAPKCDKSTALDDDAVLDPANDVFQDPQNANQSMQDMLDTTPSNSNVPSNVMDISCLVDESLFLEPETIEDGDNDREAIIPSSDGLAHPLPGEPAWVAEYDQSLIDELRGFVVFVD